MPYVKLKEAKEMLGIRSSETIRRWAREGKIDYVRVPSGQYRFDVESALPHSKGGKGKKYIYARVSTSKQKEDLNRQIEDLKKQYPNHEVIKDIASGINFKRKGLNKILAKAVRGEVKEVVVAYRDRLCRIAWDHFKELFNLLNVNLVVANDSKDPTEGSSEQELAEDLLSLIHVFSCRHYGMRRRKRSGSNSEKQSTEETEEETKE